jgi:hypothetical protein
VYLSTHFKEKAQLSTEFGIRVRRIAAAAAGARAGDRICTRMRGGFVSFFCYLPYRTCGNITYPVGSGRGSRFNVNIVVSPKPPVPARCRNTSPERPLPLSGNWLALDPLTQASCGCHTSKAQSRNLRGAP